MVWLKETRRRRSFLYKKLLKLQYFICFFKRSCKQLKSYSLFRETNVRAIYHPPDPSNIFEVLNYSESKTDSIKNAMPKFE